MGEFIFKNISDLTKKSEMRISKAVTRFLLYFNCIIISIWTSECIGLGYSYPEISYTSIARFVFSLQIIIPVFIFLFVLVLSRAITRTFVTLTALALKRPIEFFYLDGKSPTDFLIKQNVLTADFQPAEGYPGYLDKLIAQNKAAKKGEYWIDYTCTTFITIWFIYDFIVPDRFPTLFYTWINVFIIISFLYVFGAYVFLRYAVNLNKRIRKRLRKLSLRKEVKL